MTQTLDLLKKTCVPCEGGAEPFKGEKLAVYTRVVPDWNVIDEVKIEKKFKFKDFQQALAFVNKVGELAETEGHHPDINLHNWNRVTIALSTHAIKGLSENDFIMAVKINQLVSSSV